jgi:hypothetical protein
VCSSATDIAVLYRLAGAAVGRPVLGYHMPAISSPGLSVGNLTRCRYRALRLQPRPPSASGGARPISGLHLHRRRKSALLRRPVGLRRGIWGSCQCGPRTQRSGLCRARGGAAAFGTNRTCGASRIPNRPQTADAPSVRHRDGAGARHGCLSGRWQMSKVIIVASAGDLTGRARLRDAALRLSKNSTRLGSVPVGKTSERRQS